MKDSNSLLIFLTIGLVTLLGICKKSNAQTIDFYAETGMLYGGSFHQQSEFFVPSGLDYSLNMHAVAAFGIKKNGKRWNHSLEFLGWKGRGNIDTYPQRLTSTNGFQLEYELLRIVESNTSTQFRYGGILRAGYQGHSFAQYSLGGIAGLELLASLELVHSFGSRVRTAVSGHVNLFGLYDKSLFPGNSLNVDKVLFLGDVGVYGLEGNFFYLLSDENIKNRLELSLNYGLERKNYRDEYLSPAFLVHRFMVGLNYRFN